MIPILSSLHDETKRLMIAGSDLAVNDPKLQKLIPTLKTMGEKAPIFAKLAALTEELIQTKEETATKLIELSQLLTSILYTQGKTGEEGTLVQNEVSVTYETTLSHRRIHPLIEALTTTGSGRLQIIQEAVESGLYKDLRLVLPFISALEDSYAEIGDYVATNVLPTLDPSILPLIQAQFNLKGSKADARRLKVISSFLGKEGMSLYLEAIESGSKQVKIEAIKCLASFDEAEEWLLTYAKDKKVEVRTAAYEALASRESEKAAACVADALRGKDNYHVMYIVQNSQSKRLGEHVQSYVKQAYDTYLETKKIDDKDRFAESLRLLEGKKQEDVKALLTDIIYNVEVQAAIAREALHLLIETYGMEILKEFPNVHQLRNRASLVDFSFRYGLLHSSKEDVFEQFSRYVKRGRNDYGARLILEMMDRGIFFKGNLQSFDREYEKQSYYYDYYEEERENPCLAVEWDARWIDLFMSMEEEKLVFRLVTDGTNEKHVQYVINKLALNPYFSSSRGVNAMTALLQMNIENVFDVLVDTLKKTDKYSNSIKFHLTTVLENMRLFTVLQTRYAPQLERIAVEEIETEKIKNRLLTIAYDLQKSEESQYV
ncbi:HEAT repeat domain-containing protein [Bacillus sp. CGMCC 1.16541]|uniref:HEAT repeat domain-containing protein n=1 Tax=Bacillus sp. CGMCC 1.16541 TaxID=2185143 RepID=UPI000D7327BA|nr:HEAT repeat domain-containing protein [Bacillus sp. CGMCC 1.16541]